MDENSDTKYRKVLYYIEKGEGQPVIFIHGTLSDFREWQFQIDEFAQNYCVISYSRRYAYPNQWPGNGDDNNLVNNVEDLAELVIRRLNLGTAHLIGHSYGALTALYMAYRHPDMIRSLVLGEPPVMSLLEGNRQYSKDIDAIRENAFKPAQEAIRRGEGERAVRIFLDGVMSKEGFFNQLPSQVRTIIMGNAKSLGGELASISQRLTREDVQK